MFKAAAILEPKNTFLRNHSGFSSALAHRLSVLILILAVALITTSCGSVAQAASATNDENPHILSLAGNLPGGAVDEPYNAVLAVGGGNSPYHFSVKTGVLPPGVSLNPVTGRFSGKPVTAGNFAFEVIVTDSPNLEQGNRSFIIYVGGGINSGGGNISISVSPASVTLSSAGTQQFTATVSGTPKTGVTWSATTGSINSSGLYIAPTVNSQTTAVVTATSVTETSKSASASVTIEPVNQQSLKITTGGLPQGQQGDTYSEAFTATGGTTPYNWSISAGTPPPGITMSTNGNFAGIPTTTGTFNFTVLVADASGKTATGNFSDTIIAGGNYDGPAELPRATVPSAMADTPAPGAVINVNAGGNLQTALNAAQCGDVIQLQAGATFSGKFIVPAKNCDINHWIWIRTSSPDSALPAEGQRATPCYAGVASLEGRPQYSCANPQNVMARVEIQTKGDGPFQLATGANFYRFIGLEVT
ncbi:MAG: Ig domain-containing protein, partial [Terriglobales bacterium]